MAQLTALVIGGTGVISTACVHEAVRLGHSVTVLNRGTGTHGRLSLPPEVEMIQSDAHDADSVRAALGDRDFDVVATFMAFVPEDVRRDIALFTGRTAQYIFISSASAYQTPPAHLPVTESTPLHNPFWQYSRSKAACEEMLLAAYREAGFPITIVRPSHTYDPTMVPFDGGWTVVDRMRRGAPIIVPGEAPRSGRSPITPTSLEPSSGCGISDAHWVTQCTSPPTRHLRGMRSTRRLPLPEGPSPGMCTCRRRSSPESIPSSGPPCSATRPTR